MKCGGPLAITVHYPAPFNLECCKSSVPDMGPNTILKNKKYISNNILKVKLKNFSTYNPNEIWWTTCYHSALYGTIQFGVLSGSTMELNNYRPISVLNIFFKISEWFESYLTNRSQYVLFNG